MASPSTARAEAAAGNPPPISLRGWSRVTARAAGLIGLLLICVPLHYIWKSTRAGSPWPRIFLGAAGRVTGARVSRSGTPLRRDVVFIANHVSWIDILAIAGSSGSAFVAKAELRMAPVVGWLCTLNRTVFVSREDRMGVADQINRLKDAIAETWSITVFPEGTTTDGRSLLPFKSPLLRVLEPPPPGVLVQPLMLDYGHVGPEIGWIGAERGKDNALRVLARRGSFRVRTFYLEPFDPRDYIGRKAIAAEARGRIEAALEDVIGAPVPPFVGHDWWRERRWASESVAL
ncbi:MAG: lysophospholipid acyltransferase family protein [Sphingomonadaceae bacterium]